MKKLQIIMPMAGRGSRFFDIGMKTPKPLLNFNKKPFFVNALSSFDSVLFEIDLFCIIRREHDINDKFTATIFKYYPNAKIIYLEEETRGSLETCLASKDLLNKDYPVVILDCDLSFKSETYIQNINEICKNQISEIDGMIVSFNSVEPKYSYAITDKNNFVLKTAEKIAISNNALIGSYFFSKASEFINYSISIIEDGLLHTNEFYVSLVYNKYISNNKKILLTHSDEYVSFGTPEEFKNAESRK